MSQHVDRARRLLVPEPGRVGETVDEHIEILNAIRARKVKAAEEAMRTHLQQLIRRLAPLEQDLPDMFSV